MEVFQLFDAQSTTFTVQGLVRVHDPEQAGTESFWTRINHDNKRDLAQRMSAREHDFF